MASKRRTDLHDAITASAEGMEELAAAVAGKGRPPVGGQISPRPVPPDRRVRRPWTPAAAMEPMAPLAPPPARALAPLPNSPTPRLPADGGRKMNLLPVGMAVLILVVVGALVELMRLLGVHW